jgi:cysteinyl-tRNA synthetase
MSEALLGETFDIHGGGIDLVFPHHENEIAQSESVHAGHPFARVWMHNGFLQVEGEKMSKSLGNFITIRELEDEYPGGALRLAMLQTHYRQPINWTAAKVKEAWSELIDWAGLIYGSDARLHMSMRNIDRRAPIPDPSVENALKDDLNTPEAIAALRALFKRRDDPRAYSALIETSEFLGLFDHETIGAYSPGISSTNLGPDRTFTLHSKVESLKIALINRRMDQVKRISDQFAEEGIYTDIHPDGYLELKPLENRKDDSIGEIEELINARNEARKAKNFKESDRIRDELAGKGIVLKDGPAGTTWEVKR